jgi:hypothetical protein
MWHGGHFRAQEIDSCLGVHARAVKIFFHPVKRIHDSPRYDNDGRAYDGRRKQQRHASNRRIRLDGIRNISIDPIGMSFW